MVVIAVLSAWVAFTFLTSGGEVTVPDLQGAELQAALELASRDQLGLMVTRTGYDAGTPPGHVISQDPQAGTRIKQNRIVYVVVSQGTPSVFVPDLGALNLRNAELQLAQAGLTLGKVGHTHDGESPQGAVITQSPAPGRFVPRKSSVDILLSNGPRPAIYLLPDMTGFPMETVLERVRQWNLKTGKIAEEEREDFPPGTVTALSPLPGSAVMEGQSVHLTVSRSPRPRAPAAMVLYQHHIPPGLLEKTLTLVLTAGGEEKTVWEETVEPGSSVTVPVSVSEPGTLKAYLDGVFLEERKVP